MRAGRSGAGLADDEGISWEVGIGGMAACGGVVAGAVGGVGEGALRVAGPDVGNGQGS